MDIRQLTGDQIRAIMAKSKAIPTRSEIVRDLLRDPAPKIPAAPPRKTSGN